MLYPFQAAYYSEKNRSRIDQLAVPDLDTVEHLWGGSDPAMSFRHVLVGTPAQRSENWQAWMSAQEVECISEPKFYLLRQQQTWGNVQIDRWGVFGAISLNEPRLFIHEDVVAEGVERARLGLEYCEGDLAPIFVGCEENAGRRLRYLLQKYCINREPLLKYRESNQTQHHVWPVEAADVSRELGEIFWDAPLFLLDGHHRLAAAQQNHKLGLGDGKILACICSMESLDLAILPIHRTVISEKWILQGTLFDDLVSVGCKISEVNQCKPSALPQALLRMDPNELSCFLLHAHSDRVYRVELPQSGTLARSLATLPVAALDYEVLAKFPDCRAMPETNLRLALEHLAQDQAQVGFFMPAPTADQVRKIASQNLRMPRKSTRFVPKPALGLITRPWENSG